MGWNPNVEHGDVDASDDNSGGPFDLHDPLSVFGYHVDSVDDNLHQQLDLKHPKEE